jgi:hypothetical protein
MAGETLQFSELSPMEADFFNPVVWDGKVIGQGKREAYRSAPVGIRAVMRMTKAISAAGNALYWAGRDARRFAPTFVFQTGQTFPTNEFPGAHVVFDQEMLLTRGKKPFSLNPAEFPPTSHFQPALYAAAQPHYLQNPRMHYLRQAAAFETIQGENGPVGAIATNMEKHVRTGEYYRQVGVLAMPDQVQLGEVRHLELQGGHEMLLRTHNVFVFPDGKPVVHVPSVPVAPR